MSSYITSSVRKRRSDDESSESDDEEYSPPVKKLRNCNGDSNIKSAIVSKCQSTLSWIANLPVHNLFKLSLLRQSEMEVIDVDDDNESEDVVEVPDEDDDDIAVITDGIGSLQNNRGQSSFLQGSKNGLPKPRSFSTPRFSDGSLVGLPNIPSRKKINGFHSKDQKQSSDGPKMQKKPKAANRRNREPITNPVGDVELLEDSNESEDSADMQIITEANMRRMPLSAFSKKALSPIPVIDSASNDLVGAYGNSVNCTSPSFSSSSKSISRLCTADEVIRLNEKEVYKKLLDRLVHDTRYRPVKTSPQTAIQVDLTRDEDEEAVMALSYNKDVLRKPVNEFLEKYYPHKQLTRTIVKCPPMIKKEIKKPTVPPPSSTLPQFRPEEPKSKRKELFSAEWLQELKIQMVEETRMRMEIVKKEEATMKRLRDYRDAKRKEEKRLFDKFKVPGDVFPEPAGGQKDYPALTKEMEDMVNAALKNGPENYVLSTFNGITIARKDIVTLNPGTWLNDEIINFYLNLIVDRSQLDNYPSVYAFCTFFLPSFNSARSKSVLRWTRKVDIFSYDLILIPIHCQVHWALCAVDNRKKTITYYDSLGATSEKSNYDVRNYLIAEMKDKKKIDMDPDEYSLVVARGLPQQLNGSDCGMFCLKYSEYLSRDAPITFTQEHMPYFRRRMVYEILTKKLM